MTANRVINGTKWLDTDGRVISAHGGGFCRKMVIFTGLVKTAMGKTYFLLPI